MSNTERGIMSMLLDEEPAFESVTIDGDIAVETELFLTAMMESCTPEEFETIVVDMAPTLEMYGVIENAEAAMEAQKNIVKLNKKAKMDSLWKKAAIRLAEKAQDVEYKKYRKHRDLMLQSRTKIFAKYETKARKAARDAIANSRRKASNIGGNSGKSIVDKIDNHIKNAQMEK